MIFRNTIPFPDQFGTTQNEISKIEICHLYFGLFEIELEEVWF